MDSYKCIYLSSNQAFIQKSFRVISIANYAFLNENVDLAIRQIKNVFSKVITDFFNNSKDWSTALELIWVNKSVEHQSHASEIEFYFVIKILSIDEVTSKVKINTIADSLISILSNIKISLEEEPFDLSEYLQEHKEYNQVRAIRKRESIERLANYYMPQYYNVDSIGDYANEFDEIVNYMINIKNAIYSISILPTTFQNFELQAMDMLITGLSNLVTGFSVPRVGLVRDNLADKPLKNYKNFKETANFGLFITNAIVISDVQNIESLSSKFLLSYSGNEADNMAKVLSLDNHNLLNSILNYKISYPWHICEDILHYNRLAIFKYNNFKPFYRFPFLYTAFELSELFRVPIGTKNITAGFNILEVEKRNKTYSQGIINTADISLGKLVNLSQSNNVTLGFNLKDLTRHMLVVGVPGQGKSTFLVGLMDRLWKLHHIPFLVIEPAKNEYRALIDSIPNLQVFSPGKSNVAPYIINPFIPPKGVALEIYKSIVKAAFSIAFEMWTPLDQLFDETLNICYSKNGWLDDTVAEDGKECFSLPDFINVYKKVVNSKGYTGEYKKQIETAGVMRLNGLLEQNINIFDSQYTVPIQDIISTPTVIELSNVKDIKQKSFIIALLLNNIYAYVEANFANDGLLKNVILLEEAHVLLSGEKTSTQNESEASNAAAVKLLSNMLAEIRSRGVGIVIADQSAKKVSSEVVANTNIKLSFRLVEEIDRHIIQQSSVMNELQFDRFAKLRVGQAMVYFDQLDEAEEIELEDYRLKNSITTDLKDEELKKKMTYWKDKGKLLIPYRECSYVLCCKESCDFTIRRKARMIANNIFQSTYGNYYKNEIEFKEFYPKFHGLIIKEIERLLPEDKENLLLIICAKIYLNRKINYSSTIMISEQTRIKHASTLNSFLEGGKLNGRELE